ncbi:MAG: NACHT domain-containing protein, partial [Blastocatellia bacterium]
MSRKSPPDPPSSDERRPTVFVSYAHADAEFANRLVMDLRAKGHECWIDSSAIKAGAKWAQSIAEGIANSSVLLVIVTSQALQSDWVEKEIIWTQQEPEKKLVIPVLLENVNREPGFILLVNYQWVSFFGREYAAALEELLQALPAQPAASVPREIELDYLAWLKQEELLYLDRYTPISGGSQQQRARMRIVCSLEPFDREQPPRPFVDAVEELHRIRHTSGRAVLLGEPGGGKTTILWKLADDLVAAALKDPEAPLPLLIRLGFWNQADQPLSEFIVEQLEEAGELGKYLDTLFAKKRVALLLDGLNELPVAQRDVKYPLVRQFIEAHPKVLAVVSCRKEDYAPNYDFDLGCDRINILPLDAIRIRQFAVRYLPEQGEAFFWKLAGERTRRYHDDFIASVGAQHEERFWLAGQPPSDLKWTYDWDSENKHSRWAEWIGYREAPASLMMLARNPYMLWMLTRVYAEHAELPANRGDLFRKFVEELLAREKIPAAEWPPLIAGLAQVAYAMQSQRAPSNEDNEGGKADAGNALTVLPSAEVRNILDERSLKLAGSASLLSLGEQVRFTHQLLQEYFAARYLQSRMSAGQPDASAFWPPDRWWRRTNWEE